MCDRCKLGLKVIEKSRTAEERSRRLEENAKDSNYRESTIPEVPRGRPDGYGDLGI